MRKQNMVLIDYLENTYYYYVVDAFEGYGWALTDKKDF